VTDPYAPFPAAPVRPAVFPRERLSRAGLDDDAVARLDAEYESLDPAGRQEFSRFVTSHSDDAIRERFSAGSVEDTGRQAALPTYDDLNSETIDELDERLREWNESHPEQHLTIAGRKGEKIGRLLDAYEGEREQLGAVQTSDGVEHVGIVPASAAVPVAEQQLPTAPTATTTAGAPEAAPAAPVAPAGTVETGAASTGAQAPAQTADAAPGAGPATTEE